MNYGNILKGPRAIKWERLNLLLFCAKKDSAVLPLLYSSSKSSKIKIIKEK